MLKKSTKSTNAKDWELNLKKTLVLALVNHPPYIHQHKNTHPTIKFAGG
jgi:hypothetical protein